jgi:hypothetical protein
MSDEEVDELLKGVQVGAFVSFDFTCLGSAILMSGRSDGNVNYESFVRTILSQ